MNKILFMTHNIGVEKDELIKPRKFLETNNYQTFLASPAKKDVQTFVNDTEKNIKVKADLAITEVNVKDYQALILPGGTVNADNLRINSMALKIIKKFVQNKKLIALICHAPWVLIETKLSQNETLTSYKSLKTDLLNAKAKWFNKSVVYGKQNQIITSRNPDDIPEFNQAILKILKKN